MSSLDPYALYGGKIAEDPYAKYGGKVSGGPSNSMLQGKKAVINSELEAANPGSVVTPDTKHPGQTTMTPASTLESRTREAAIGVLEPFTAGNLLSSAEAVNNAVSNVTDWTNPGNIKAGLEQIWNLAKGAVTTPIKPVQDFAEGIRTGDYDKAAYGSGGMLSQTEPAIEGGFKAAEKVLPLDTLREQTRRAAQNLTSSSAFKTTEPIVEKYNTAATDTAARQAESDANVAEKNRQAQEAAAGKTTTAQAAHDAKTAEQQAAYKAKATEAIAANREAEHANTRTAAVNRSIEEGSKRLGDSVNDLDLKLREEGNGKYDVVKKATAEDPGIPLQGMAQAAREAQQKLSGSAESIKQFNELIRKGSEEEGIVAGGMEVGPGDRLYEMLKSQGAIGDAGNINFKDLQGYSSEIGRKLAQGNLPGDVYQALKYMKEKIDIAKAEIAGRNGVGPALQDAESFWHDYLDLFYDKDSSVAKVRESIGVKNPGEAANEFFRGNADEIAVGKLKRLRSVYAKDANAVADLTQNLKAARNEAAASKVVKPQELPAAPKPGQAPQPTVAATTPRKMIEGPDAPTAENIVADKRARIEAKGRSLMEVSKYDAGTLASAPIGYALGHPLLGLVPLASKYGLSFLLTRPSVIDWIARPTTTDLMAIDKLPPAAKAQVSAGLQQIMDQESAAGRQVTPAAAVRNFLARTAIISGAARNRREALEAVGRPTP